MMTRATRVIWILAGAVAIVGVIAFFIAYRPGNLDDLRASGFAYVRETISPFVTLTALLAAAGAGAAAIAERREKRRAPPPSPGSSISPMAVLDAETALGIREALIELGDTLRTYLEGRAPDMIGFVEALLQGAVRVGASDIHLQPHESGTRVALRVHGVLEELVSFPPEQQPRFIMRMKVLARLVAYRSDRPQDGHFSIETPDGSADVRVSLVPTNHGEKVSLRIARGGIELPDLTSLGFPAPLFERYRATLARNQGLIFLTGPTGSGKTTTIYASLGHIKKTRGGTTQIATIEDPVEFDVPFLTQTQVNNEVGMTFAQGLRSILRQDPNVMMVGEIRDAETARIAVQAGLTGHLILTTVHADSSAGVFNRLIESGVEPFVLASASLASVSQRLVRALCPRCRAPAPASPDEEARLLQSGLPAGGLFYVAVGCKKCGGAGYLGRTAIYELLTVSMAIRDLINAKVPTPHIQQRAVFEGMVPLLTAGVERARSGATTLAEVLRVCA
ncbi:MAG: GspE/PulE family protein [Myxococcota bacterium]